MRVQLFATCLVDTFYPQTGEAMVKLLRHFGVDARTPRGQTCCGKPADSGGYVRESREAARHFLSVFGANGDPIVTPSGSCASMVKNHYPHLFKNDPGLRQKAEDVGSRIFELTQFLVHVCKAHETGFKGKGRITYHASCQLIRELLVREEPVMLLRSMQGVEFVPMPDAERCCGFGGIFMGKQPEISMAMADEKLDSILRTGADTVTGCDHGCLMNIADAVKRRGADVRVTHIAAVLAEGLP
ncbi:MAG: (Fe-S)-binding protein [Desulfomonile sp.]|nr:(Fe-S)-binding protein [Desulfomonile sp.]